MTEVASSSSNDFDERESAKGALEASEEHLQALCASHAGTFVAVERRGRALRESLQELLTATEKIDLETVQSQLETPEGEEHLLAVLSERHRVRRRTLLQHSSLLELLELPSLMDACVRSSLYDEALSIASFANTLERRHPDHNTVVTQVISQIRSRQADLRKHTLHRLKSQVTMPQCLEIVTALRRLNSIELERQAEVNLERLHRGMEMRLQVDFLEARDVWLDSRVTASPGSLMGNEQVLDAIERYRTRVFEVATQFNAIFRAQSQPSSSSLSLLSMWMARRIRSFLELLEKELVTIEDSSSLRDVLEAAVFFATSLGRLGADFTAQLPKLFEPKMLSLVEALWMQGLEQLRETLRICRDAGVASPLLSQSLDVAEETDVPDSLDEPMPPPRLLLTLPPLARLVNAVLTGLNELRRCLMPGIFSQLRHALEKLINDVKAELADNERAVLKPGFRGETAQLREVASKFKKIFNKTIEPYLRGSLEAALGNTEKARAAHQIYFDSIRVAQEEAAPILATSGEAEDPAEAKGDVFNNPDGDHGGAEEAGNDQHRRTRGAEGFTDDQDESADGPEEPNNHQDEDPDGTPQPSAP